MVSSRVVPCAGSRITERLIGLIDQLRASFGLLMQRGRMDEAIGVPDLHLFMPGPLDIGVRRVGRQFQDGVIVSVALVVHWCPCVVGV